MTTLERLKLQVDSAVRMQKYALAVIPMSFSEQERMRVLGLDLIIGDFGIVDLKAQPNRLTPKTPKTP
jgi:hypothetical protein